MRLIWTIIGTAFLAAGCSTTNSPKTGLAGSKGASPKPVKMALYESPDGYTIEYPADWKVNDENHSFSMPLESAVDGWMENFNIQSENLSDKSKVTVGQYAGRNCDTLKNDRKAEILEKKDITVGGIPAVKAVYLSRTKESRTIKADVYFLLKDNKGYIISCGMLENTYDDYHAMFDKIVNSLKFK
jgi:hypothetical protein